MTDRRPDDASRAAILETPSSLLGTVLSHYRILEYLGGGGMGVVYRAVDTKLERQVALKFLPPELSHLSEAKERFFQEARSASALDHPNICTIYEIDQTDDGQLFLAMAYYEGETLKQRIEHGRLEVVEALDVAHQIASGLAVSHAQDIIHRDVKPANIWLARAEHEASARVRILDFGLAKVLGQSDLTRSGSSMGTPAYMSPEHARGERVDPRTDLWSLGVLLYEALTGVVPFTGNTIPAVMYALLSTDPRPVRELRSELSPELESLMARLMEKEVEDRTASCHELLAELEALPEWKAFTPTPSGTFARPAAMFATETGSGIVELREIVESELDERPTRPPRQATPRPTLFDPRTPRPPITGVAPSIVPPSPAVDTTPADPSTEAFQGHLRRGLGAALARDYQTAAEAFEEALKLRPGDSRARFNLDKVRAKLAGRG